MKTPTLEEVKNRYANVKEVRCANSKTKGLVTFKNIEVLNDGSIVQDFRGENWIVLYYAPKDKHAEIISYKSNPNIDLSKLTPELITELCKDENIKQTLINNGVVTEPKKEETYIKIPLSIITLTDSKKKLGALVKSIAENY
jgi:hypothetical protein